MRCPSEDYGYRDQARTAGVENGWFLTSAVRVIGVAIYVCMAVRKCIACHLHPDNDRPTGAALSSLKGNVLRSRFSR